MESIKENGPSEWRQQQWRRSLESFLLLLLCPYLKDFHQQSLRSHLCMWAGPQSSWCSDRSNWRDPLQTQDGPENLLLGNELSWTYHSFRSNNKNNDMDSSRGVPSLISGHRSHTDFLPPLVNSNPLFDIFCTLVFKWSNERNFALFYCCLLHWNLFLWELKRMSKIIKCKSK